MSAGELKFEIRDGAVRISVPGSLYDQESCDSLMGFVKHQLAAGNKSIYLDIGACAAVSSYGLGQLLGINSTVKSAGGQLTIGGTRKEVKEILAALLLDQILKFV